MGLEIKNIIYLIIDFDIKILFFYDRWLKLIVELKDGSEIKICDFLVMRIIFNINRIWIYNEILLIFVFSVMNGVLIWVIVGSLRWVWFVVYM